MKRDMELIRKIALLVEELPLGSQVFTPNITLDGYSANQIKYNCHLMAEADLVDCIRRATRGEPYGIFINGLTWSGHDFVDAVRNDAVWSKVSERAKSLSVELSIEGAKYVSRKAGEQLYTHGLDWFMKTDWSWLTSWPV